jgi:uroporphyrin-III C-methyltransferase
VFLVGAGPGDPELLTVKALKVIAEADVIVYDRLVSEPVLDHAPRGAARINVGKRPNHHPVPQEEINDLLVRLARSGRTVVRLKGGDPLIFGRGGEEALHLRCNRIACEVVPGITAAQGASAGLCLPLTHRGRAAGVHYVTGHCRQNLALDLDWRGLADSRDTLVIYMGAASIAQMAGELMAHGRAGSTPAVAVNNATLPSERRLFSTLDRIAPDCAAAAFVGPILFIVGEVVALHGQLSANGERDELAHLAAGVH